MGTINGWSIQKAAGKPKLAGFDWVLQHNEKEDFLSDRPSWDETPDSVPSFRWYRTREEAQEDLRLWKSEDLPFCGGPNRAKGLRQRAVVRRERKNYQINEGQARSKALSGKTLKGQTAFGRSSEILLIGRRE